MQEPSETNNTAGPPSTDQSSDQSATPANSTVDVQDLAIGKECSASIQSSLNNAPLDSSEAVLAQPEVVPKDGTSGRKRTRTYPGLAPASGRSNVDYSAQYERRALDYSTEVDVDRVLAYASRHQRFIIRDIEMNDLPKYDDTTPYKIPDQEEHRLWRLETERLLKVATGPEHVLFDSGDVLGNANKENFKNVEAITDQIMCNLAIIHHDNMLLDRCDKGDRAQKRHYRACQTILQSRLSESTHDDDEDSYRRQKPRILDKDNRKLYFDFVNFITAILARYLYRCASASQWHDICFSTLAKWSTKLKILEKDPVGYATMSLESADDLDDEREQISYANFLEARNPFSKEDDDKFSPSDVYHSVESNFRDILFYMFGHIIRSPWVNDESGYKKDYFQVTTRVYRNGFESSHTAISSDRDAEFAAANDPQQLRYIRAALDILLSGARQIGIRHKDRGPQEDGTDTVTLEWNWNVADISKRPNSLRHPAQGNTRLTRMDDVVSMMTAHTLSGPDVSSEMRSMIFLFYHYLLIADTEDHMAEYIDEDLVAHVNIYNKSFADSKHYLMTGEDFKSLNEANMFATRMLPGSALMGSGKDATITPVRRGLFRRFSNNKNEMEGLRAKMQATEKWRFDEKVVIVPCKTYVRTCLIISAIIVLGGLAIPFSSRVRLHGVDPFNITTFTWIAVVFFLFLAQSRYVPVWAWHDFLHSRIICKNVSELAHVSGLDPQLVLHKLLVKEKSTNLHTRGPYNSMFTRSAPDGFSINVPCTTSTLYASGFVLFLGIGKTDRHIQVNDARPVPEFFNASHHNWQKCMGVPLPVEHGIEESSSAQDSHQDVLRLRVDMFESERILGLFVGSRNFG